MPHQSPFWTHPSILRLPRADDPVEYIIRQARALVLEAIEQGWTGPPYDPFALAQHAGFTVVPREDIHDARTVPLKGKQFQIEFNPNRPRSRVRYSIAHELAHTLFPDCHERVRNRAAREHMQGTDWQLELLCNLAAAELLMPIGSFPDLKGTEITIDTLMELRKRYEVSTEAILLRVVKLTEHACSMFCASRLEADEPSDAYQIDYTVPSRTWSHTVPSGVLLPPGSIVRECTAIGFTAKGDEEWSALLGDIHVEAVGIPPYPKHSYPRVVGLISPLEPEPKAAPGITYLKGDATAPRGNDYRIIAHVVNDRAARWGGGFALVVRRRLPPVQQDFLTWAESHKQLFCLGHVRFSPVDDTLAVLSMICQQGFGPSKKPRIRYAAMKSCLAELAEIAIEKHASVHMPRIGCGQAGGAWMIVSELIQESLCDRGIRVTVYDLPSSEGRERQVSLFQS